MGKHAQRKTSKRGTQLGRAIIKDRFGASKRDRDAPETHNDVADLDEKDALTLGVQAGGLASVVETTDLGELLEMAILSDRDFVAEKDHVTIVNMNGGDAEEPSVTLTEEEKQEKLKVPRRPAWTPDMPAATLDANERAAFLNWRRGLAQLEESGVCLTPFEKNLDIWRQLWRVVERSHAVVQILDARNPLYFRCPDLETMVHEVDPLKKNVLILNKADLVPTSIRRMWAEYFRSQGVGFLFFSALEGSEATRPASAAPPAGQPAKPHNEEEDEESDGPDEPEMPPEAKAAEAEARAARAAALVAGEGDGTTIIGPDQLFDVLEAVGVAAEANGASGHAGGKKRTVVGMVGYPNVGKSSTINLLVGSKKVRVGATPGKTKHLQTILLGDDLCLCDCPGLVFPSVASSKAEMVTAGVLPIDQMKEHFPPMELVCQRIPKALLERTYGVVLPQLREGQANVSAEDLLMAYGCLRGYMTSHGRPDLPRSARYILKDYVAGKLSYCLVPPGTPAKLEAQTRADHYASQLKANATRGARQREEAAERRARAQPSSSSIIVEKDVQPTAAKFLEEDELYSRPKSEDIGVFVGGKRGKKSRGPKGAARGSGILPTGFTRQDPKYDPALAVRGK